MGGVLSQSYSNNELVDNLFYSGYIECARVQEAFRLVSIERYIFAYSKVNSRFNSIWAHRRHKMIKPTLAAELLSALKLRKSDHVLIVGNGCGFLSTLVSVIVGFKGSCIAIEIDPEIHFYAKKRWKMFKKSSLTFDMCDICEPIMLQDNVFNWNFGNLNFNRILILPAISPKLLIYFLNLLRIGGMMIFGDGERYFNLERLNKEKISINIRNSGLSNKIIVSPHCNEFFNNLSINFDFQQPEIISKLEKYLPDIDSGKFMQNYKQECLKNISLELSLNQIASHELPTLQNICRASFRQYLRQIVDTTWPHYRDHAINDGRVDPLKNILDEPILVEIEENSEYHARRVLFNYEIQQLIYEHDRPLPVVQRIEPRPIRDYFKNQITQLSRSMYENQLRKPSRFCVDFTDLELDELKLLQTQSTYRKKMEELIKKFQVPHAIHLFLNFERNFLK